MKRKTSILALLLSIGCVSCIPVITQTPTSTPAVVSTLPPRVIEPFITSNGIEDISNIIVQIYSIKPECTHSMLIDNPDLETKVKFLDIEEPNDLDTWWVTTISENPDDIHQAYIACVDVSSELLGCTDHVYVKNKSSGSVFEIEFHDLPSRGPLLHIIWIGNNVLAFTENLGPQVDAIYAIDLTKEEILYYSVYDSQCK